jgi:hypothetical protein
MNEIRVVAESDCGSATTVWNVQQTRCDAPEINLSSSAGNQQVTANPEVNISGNILNVDASNQIQMTLNNNPVNFVYNPVSDVFGANVNLIQGSNTIRIVATNACGSDEQVFSLTYTPAQVIQPPQVQITTPATSPFETNTASMTVHANVLYVSTANQISVTVNGNSTPFTYNAAQNKIQFNQNWIEGNNVIVVTAANNAGTASDSKTVIYRKPQQIFPPVITYTNPTNNPHTVNTNQYTVTGTITNITSLNQVQAVLNNQPLAQYNPSLSNGTLSFSVPLTFDNNHNSYTIQFTATNAAGSDQESRTINRQVNNQPGGGGNCMPVVGANFAPNHQSVTVNSTKDLSNVVVKFHDNTTQKFDNLSGYTGTFAGTGANQGKCIVGVWIKSGCNMSNDGPGYGEWVPNTNYNGQCNQNQPCGPRFNPGNSDWQFCLITPSGTYNRGTIAANPNFSYQGPATSAYFLPIAGGANVTVNGNPFPIESGRYYLFTGNLTVDVRNNHPGAMGHWQICIQADRAPVSGNGANRPPSPCEQPAVNPGQGGNNNQGGNKAETKVETTRPATMTRISRIACLRCRRLSRRTIKVRMS